jgi:DNA adenine methylase
LKAGSLSVPRIEPVIKWSGSKRSVASKLASLFPPAERYLEPFVGGGALLPFRNSRHAVAGDVVNELVELWKVVRDDPERVASSYSEIWNRRQREGHLVYYEIRERFNKKRDPIDFLFLSRTCVNGLIRFNKEGQFNNSLHHTRPGVHPQRLRATLLNWSAILQGVDFVSSDYKVTLSSAKADDFIFLDPPYEATKGRYLPGTFVFSDLLRELGRLNGTGARWMLTFDGYAGSRQYSAEIPKTMFKHHLHISTGLSPFTRLMGTTLDEVYESVYLNYDPPLKSLTELTENLVNPLQLQVAYEM